MRRFFCRLLFPALLVVASCSDDGRRRATPTQPIDPLAGQWQTATVAKSFSLDELEGDGLVGSWRGAVRVESTSAAPQCSASPWSPASVHELRAEVLLLEDGLLDLHLFEPSESDSVCHLELAVDGTRVRATPWYDYFGDSTSCHFALSRAGWSCTEGSGEIWILGLELEGSLSRKGKTLSGTILASYDWRH